MLGISKYLSFCELLFCPLSGTSYYVLIWSPLVCSYSLDLQGPFIWTWFHSTSQGCIFTKNQLCWCMGWKRWWTPTRRRRGPFRCRIRWLTKGWALNILMRQLWCKIDYGLFFFFQSWWHDYGVISCVCQLSDCHVTISIKCFYIEKYLLAFVTNFILWCVYDPCLRLQKQRKLKWMLDVTHYFPCNLFEIEH